MRNPGFGPIHSRCDDGRHGSIEAVSERLEAWGHSPEEAYRIASLYAEDVDQ